MYPRLLHIYGPIWIQMYGVMIALSFIVFLFLTIRHPRRKKIISTERFLNTVFVGLASGIIGGRVFYAVTHTSELSGRWTMMFLPWVEGFTVLGSIIGAIIGVSFYLRWHKSKILPIFDLASIYTPLMQSIARIGCLFAGCCYGIAAPTLPWAITFTNPHAHAPLYVPLHPTQIYASLASLTIFFIIKILSPRLIKKTGTVFCLFLILENAARFIVDFWRADREILGIEWIDKWGILSQAQWFSIAGFTLATLVFLFIWFRNRHVPIHLY